MAIIKSAVVMSLKINKEKLKIDIVPEGLTKILTWDTLILKKVSFYWRELKHKKYSLDVKNNFLILNVAGIFGKCYIISNVILIFHVIILEYRIVSSKRGNWRNHCFFHLSFIIKKERKTNPVMKLFFIRCYLERTGKW